MKVGFTGLTENIVYVRPLGGVHKRAPGELLATASGEKTTQKRSIKLNSALSYVNASRP